MKINLHKWENEFLWHVCAERARVKVMRKIVAMFLAFAMVLSITVNSNRTNLSGDALDTEYTYEEVTIEFDIFDVLNILKNIVGIEALVAEQIELYDFFGDGDITIFNALEILKMIVGLEEFPVKELKVPIENPKPSRKPEPKDYTEFAPAAADFTVDVFKRAFEESLSEGKQNSLVSPLSALLALAMTANGADGDTLAEMEAVLGRGMSLEELNALLSAYVFNLPSYEGSKLSIANSIWYRKGVFNVSDTFLQTNRDYYNAEIEPADFNEQTLVDINNWVSRNTDEMITEIIGAIPPDAIMYLINAIAFDSEWEETYAEDRVWQSNFAAFGGRNQNAELMWADENLYLDDGKAIGFVKPYKDGAYSFAALLPNEGVDITEYVAEMTGESLTDTLQGAVQTEVVTALPKFSYEFDIEMSGLLKGMGMSDAFSQGRADFSRLGTSPYGNIFINRVIHKTFIEVDEKGTKAAAVTAVEMATCSVPSTPFVVLNRPFVYAIIDNENNLPIFIGTLLEIPD
ncbi:MAG: serpin family protein [Oscillospiraceae bacterium]|nr:serpin family protein [Oscillospiraceae bacterium]